MRVLIIEDETRLAALVVDGLARAGIRGEAVHDGLTGLERGSTETWDAILLDILLPGMNGFAVCRELRAAGVTTPILMLTAKDGDLDETEALIDTELILLRVGVERVSLDVLHREERLPASIVEDGVVDVRDPWVRELPEHLRLVAEAP